MKAPQDIRLQVYLARSGLASRRACEEYIASGRISVNGIIRREMGIVVQPTDVIAVDGKHIDTKTSHVYFVLNKPVGYICSDKDPEDRPLARSLIPYTGRLFSVGRLDVMTSGLLLYTNDGAFTFRVSHPGQRVEKEYLIQTARQIPVAFLERYRRGLNIEGEQYKLLQYTLHGYRSVTLVLIEGKNREIRNVFRSWQIPIKSIERRRIASLRLGKLQAGESQKLTSREIKKHFKYDSNN